jgi:CBS domain containing-hemolysin-like protein
MDRTNLAGMLALGLPALIVHLVSIALTKALHCYSPSLLGERCSARGRSERAESVYRFDHKTERAAEALAVLTGLLLAALVGVAVGLLNSASRLQVVILPVLLIGLLGYVVAGVIGKVFAEAVVDLIWPVASLMRAAAFPLTFGLRQVERLMELLAGGSDSIHRPASLQVEVPVEHTEADTDAEPDLPKPALALLKQAVALTRLDVGELMTPRSSIVSLPASVSAAEAAATFRRTGFSRVPIFGESRDDIVGILYAKDLFARMTEGRPLAAISPAALARPAIFVPESKNAFELLHELRDQRRHVALVLDEYGGVAGLITLEDLLEELVGRIDDEHDSPAPADPVRALGSSRYEVDATFPLEDLNERLGLHLPTDLEFQTIGGLVFHELGRLPGKGDSVSAYGIAITVIEVSDHSIRRLIIDLVPNAERVENAVIQNRA